MRITVRGHSSVLQDEADYDQMGVRLTCDGDRDGGTLKRDLQNAGQKWPIRLTRLQLSTRNGLEPTCLYVIHEGPHRFALEQIT